MQLKTLTFYYFYLCHLVILQNSDVSVLTDQIKN